MASITWTAARPSQDIEQALGAFEAAGIFVCYNLLLFEPDAVLDDVRENIAFIRRHPAVPVNFCRAEPYHGTPLYQRVRERGTLLGSYLGWDYRIQDDRTELAFRMAAAAFRERNFDAEGVANRTMGLGYTAQLLRCFFDVSSARGRRLLERAERLIRDVSLDTADLLEQAVELAARADLADHDRITRETALLGLRVAAHNRLWHAALDDLNQRHRCVRRRGSRVERERATVPEKARAVLEQLAVAGCFAASVQACGGDTENDQGTAGAAGYTAGRTGSGGFLSDPLPGTGGQAAAGRGSGGFVSDPLPFTGGHATGGRGSGGFVVDCLGGALGVGGRATGGRGSGGFVVDCLGGALGVGGRGSGGILSDPLPGTWRSHDRRPRQRRGHGFRSPSVHRRAPSRWFPRHGWLHHGLRAGRPRYRCCERAAGHRRPGAPERGIFRPHAGRSLARQRGAASHPLPGFAAVRAAGDEARKPSRRRLCQGRCPERRAEPLPPLGMPGQSRGRGARSQLAARLRR